MSRPAALWAAWVRLLDRREPGDALAILRIGVGLVVAGSLIWLAAVGLVDVIWLDRTHGGYRTLERVPHLVRWLGGPTPAVIWGIVVAGIAGGLLVAVGLGGRLSAFVALQAMIALHRLNDEVSGSADVVMTNALWILVLARSTETLSLDCWLKRRRFRSDEEVPAFPRYLVLLQLALIYGSTGLAKLSVHWLPLGGYSAIYYIMQQPAWQRFDMTWVSHAYPVTQLATAVTWLFEITSPLLLVVYYCRRTADRGGRLRRWLNRFDLRIPYALTGLSLHVFIFATMVVGPFSHIMLALYVCMWSPAELRAAWARVRAKLGRGAVAAGEGAAGEGAAGAVAAGEVVTGEIAAGEITPARSSAPPAP